MLRSIASAQARALLQTRRNFVSTVLLTRNWENESFTVLKKEAKNRGLPAKENKATLITRLQEHDQAQLETPPIAVQQAQQIRLASTATEVPGIPASSEPSEIPPNYPKNFLDVRLPSTEEPSREAEVQIPFLPDLWDSSRVKAESEPIVPVDDSAPNVIVIAGDASHISGSPVHNIDALEPHSAIPSQTPKASQSIFQDMAEDLLLPTSLTLSPANVPSDIIKVTSTSAGQETDHSRKFDREEKYGVWEFLGIFIGSFLAAAYFKTPSAFAEKTPEPVAVGKEGRNSH